MIKETAPAVEGRRGANMSGLRLGGALWLTAGVCCTGLLIVVFVGENLLLESPVLSALFLGGAIAALLTGGLLLVRPGPGAVRWSTVVGVGWLVAYGSVAVRSVPDGGADVGPLLSLTLILSLGIAGALVTYWSGRSVRRVG